MNTIYRQCVAILDTNSIELRGHIQSVLGLPVAPVKINNEDGLLVAFEYDETTVNRLWNLSLAYNNSHLLYSDDNGKLKRINFDGTECILGALVATQNEVNGSDVYIYNNVKYQVA
jgi:hypothetical protein